MSKSRFLAIAVPLAAATLVAAAPALAQLDLPRPSPKATVSQTVGLTDVTVTYCRPGVKGRVIWGGLVPYNQDYLYIFKILLNVVYLSLYYCFRSNFNKGLWPVTGYF